MLLLVLLPHALLSLFCCVRDGSGVYTGRCRLRSAVGMIRNACGSRGKFGCVQASAGRECVCCCCLFRAEGRCRRECELRASDRYAGMCKPGGALLGCVIATVLQSNGAVARASAGARVVTNRPVPLVCAWRLRASLERRVSRSLTSTRVNKHLAARALAPVRQLAHTQQRSSCQPARASLATRAMWRAMYAQCSVHSARVCLRTPRASERC